MKLNQNPKRNELNHIGILGMRWGKRKGRTTRRITTSSYKPAHKHPHEMSTDDLKAVINRLTLEKQYKDLTKREQSIGRKFVTSFLQETGKKALTAYADKLIADKIKSR